MFEYMHGNVVLDKDSKCMNHIFGAETCSNGDNFSSDKYNIDVLQNAINVSMGKQFTK